MTLKIDAHDNSLIKQTTTFLFKLDRLHIWRGGKINYLIEGSGTGYNQMQLA